MDKTKLLRTLLACGLAILAIGLISLWELHSDNPANPDETHVGRPAQYPSVTSSHSAPEPTTPNPPTTFKGFGYEDGYYGRAFNPPAPGYEHWRRGWGINVRFTYEEYVRDIQQQANQYTQEYIQGKLDRMLVDNGAGQ